MNVLDIFQPSSQNNGIPSVASNAPEEKSSFENILGGVGTLLPGIADVIDSTKGQGTGKVAQEVAKEQQRNAKLWLYIGIGSFFVVAGVVLWIILKKKSVL